MGRARKFAGEVVDIKALLTREPKVRVNAWEQGAPGATRSPALPQASPRQSVRRHLRTQSSTKSQPAMTRPPLEELAILPQEDHKPSKPQADADMELGPDTTCNDEMDFGSIDSDTALEDAGVQVTRGRHRHRHPRRKKPCDQAVIAHSEHREFEVPSGGSSASCNGEVHPMDDEMQFAGGGGQAKVVPEFWQALKDGDEKAVSRLIGASACLNAKDKDGDTPLIKASEYGLVGIVKIFLDAGAGINKRGRAKQTPLMRAVVFKRGDVAELLIEAGANANIPDSDGKRPIFRAVEQNNAVLVELLFAHSNEDSALLPHAVQVVLDSSHGREVLAMLLKKGCSVAGLSWLDMWGETALVQAVRANRPEVVEVLLHAGAPIGDAAQGASWDCRQVFQDFAERHAVVLTLHVEPAASEDMFDVICTDMGGNERASVSAISSAPFKDLRTAIEADLRKCEISAPQLILPDGHLLATGDDEKLLSDVLGSAAQTQASMDLAYI